MKLTSENYYSDEANKEYMSASQLKDFMKCEAYAKAKIQGEWSDGKPSQAMLVGSYVDSYFTDDIEAFIAMHPEILKRDGTLKAEYNNAENIITRIEKDELMMKFLSGEKQVIMTGKLYGIPFKCKMDSYFPDVNGTPVIVDLKIMKDFKSVWNEELHTKQPFIEAWRYDVQATVYSEIVKHNIDTDKDPLFVIAGATKEKESGPDIGLFDIPADRRNAILNGWTIGDKYESGLDDKIPYFDAVKKGIFEPIRCETCAYCKATKKLIGAVDYREV